MDIGHEYAGYDPTGYDAKGRYFSQCHYKELPSAFAGNGTINIMGIQIFSSQF
jgi:hypothetical protein